MKNKVLNARQAIELYCQTYKDHELVLLERKESYGNVRFYPLNRTAQLLTELIANQKTLTRKNLEIIEELGHEIEIVYNEVNWRSE